MALATFIAHYRSPDASANRAKGLFEFESEARFGSRANAHDARLRMLELYGNDALAWNIEKIEKKTQKKNDRGEVSDGQLELDFRDPVKKPKRKRSRKYY